ncbi:10890_t:CDS:2, partial [Funneliformis caledonium]
TDWAISGLTSEIGRVPVLFTVYGRNCLNSENINTYNYVILKKEKTENTSQINGNPCRNNNVSDIKEFKNANSNVFETIETFEINLCTLEDNDNEILMVETKKIDSTITTPPENRIHIIVEIPVNTGD